MEKERVSIASARSLSPLCNTQCLLCSQGRPGDKGQKGELGSPGFDVLSAVKVSKPRYPAEVKQYLPRRRRTRRNAKMRDARSLSLSRFSPAPPASQPFGEQSRKAVYIVWRATRRAEGERFARRAMWDKSLRSGEKSGSRSGKGAIFSSRAQSRKSHFTG